MRSIFIALILFGANAWSAQDLIDKVQPSRDTAQEKSIYQVVYEVIKDGHTLDSATVILAAHKSGEITSSRNGAKSTFAVMVSPVMSDRISVDYRLRTMSGKKTFELAETAVPFVIGSPLTSDVHDSNGDGFQLKVTVVKK